MEWGADDREAFFDYFSFFSLFFFFFWERGVVGEDQDGDEDDI